MRTSSTPFPDEREDLAGPGVPAKFRFLEHRGAVHRDFEAPTTRWDQLDLGVGKLLSNGVRQTGGSWFVVSNDAEFDGNTHAYALVFGLRLPEDIHTRALMALHHVRW